MTRTTYLDPSALVKLVIDEPGSAAMRRWFIEAERVATSRIGIVETRRAAARRPHDAAHLRAVLESVIVVEFDAAVADRVASVRPASIRTLDAVHVATALMLGASLEAFVTYDEHQAAAARDAGLPVVSPAA